MFTFKFSNMRRPILTALIIVLCAAALSATAYAAYFYMHITSGYNVVTSSCFGIESSIAVASGENTAVAAETDGSYVVPAGEYTVKLNKKGTAKNGFVVVKTEVNGAESVLHTSKITDDEFKFTIKVQGEDPVKITFTPYWGVSTSYGFTEDEASYITADKVITLGESSAQDRETGENADNQDQANEGNTDNRAPANDENADDQNQANEENTDNQDPITDENADGQNEITDKNTEQEAAVS